MSASEVDNGEVILAERFAMSRELAPGRWHLQVALGNRHLPVHAPSSGRRSLPSITLVVEDGPYTASLLRTNRGLALRVARRKPFVEVDTLDVDGSTLRIDARLVPDTDDTQGELVARSRRRRDVAVTVPVEITDGRLRAVLGLDTLPSEDRETWDLRLRLASGRSFRLGSHLDDTSNKRKVVTFPAHHVDRAGRQLALQPCYTVRNTVSVLARPVEDAPEQVDG